MPAAAFVPSFLWQDKMVDFLEGIDPATFQPDAVKDFIKCLKYFPGASFKAEINREGERIAQQIVPQKGL